MGFEPTIFGSGNRRLVHLATGTPSQARDPGFTNIAESRFKHVRFPRQSRQADIAQLGERQTEDLKVAGSIPAVGILFFCLCLHFIFADSVWPYVDSRRACWLLWSAIPWQLGRVVKAID